MPVAKGAKSRRKAPPKARRLPPLPKSWWSPYGVVPVHVVPDLKSEDGEACFGLWNPLTREISICAGMKREVAWLTLWHEVTHMDLQEIGVRITEDQIEAVCNAIAQARVQEMLAR
jgi:hypothetical protein